MLIQTETIAKDITNVLNERVEKAVRDRERKILKDLLLTKSEDEKEHVMIEQIESLEDHIMTIYKRFSVDEKSMKRTIRRLYDLKLLISIQKR